MSIAGPNFEGILIVLVCSLILFPFIFWCRHKPKWKPCKNGNHKWPKHKTREKRMHEGKEVLGPWIETPFDEWTPQGQTWFSTFRICECCGMMQRKEPAADSESFHHLGLFDNDPIVYKFVDCPGDWRQYRAQFS